MATIIEILETDRLVDSRADLNSNFTALNTAKVDGATALTTAGRLVEVASSGVATQTSFASSVVVLTSGSYADPAWVTSLATSKLSGTVADTNLASTAVTPAAYGAAASVATFTVDAKGRLTAGANVAIAIAASQVTSGTFADALVAASNVTQHQAALSLATSQITGTKAGATFLSDYATAFVTSLTGTANQITVSAAAGAITISIPTNPTLPGTTTGTFSGNLTGNVTGNASGTAATITGALALANTPLTTRGDLLVATTATPILGRLAKGTQYQVLLGGATDPTWGAVDLAQASAVTGLLPLGNGGTGATTLAGAGIVAGSASITTANALLIGASAGTLGQSDATFVSGVLTRAGTLGLSATGANVVTFSTNGVERIRTTSAGLTGFGATNPLSVVSVVGASRAAAGDSTHFAIYTGTGAATDNQLLFGIYDANYSWIQATHPGTAHRNLVLQGLGGNLLIGTTTDDGASKLQVAGTIAAISASWATTPGGANRVIRMKDTSGANTDFSFATRIDNNGDFGLYDETLALYSLFVANTGNVSVGGKQLGNYRLDVQSSGSAGTLRVYDQTATTGVTSLVVRAGAGQSTTALTTWQNNAGTALAFIGSDGVFNGYPIGTITDIRRSTGLVNGSIPALTEHWASGSATPTSYSRLGGFHGNFSGGSKLSYGLFGDGVFLDFFTVGAYSVKLSPNQSTKIEANNTGIGFFGVTPVAQQVEGAGDAAAIITALKNLGLMAP